MNIDWADPKRTDVFHFQMVDPNNLDEVYGDIEDVQLGSSPITYGYFTDTRYSSQITFLHGNNYIDNTWIRIIHEVPKYEYVNELGTFVPTAPAVNYSGAETQSLSLQSPLWAISNDLATSAFTIAKGASRVKAFQSACNKIGRPFVMKNPNDYTAGSAIVYEPGTSWLSILFDIANASNNRLDLDGHGNITLSPSIRQKTVTPIIELDVDDPRSMIIQDTIVMEKESEEIPSRVIVSDENYIGYVDLPTGSPFSAAQRGYIKAELHSESGLQSVAQARSLAQSLLNGYNKSVHWTMDTMYFPAHCGDNVYFTIDGVKRLCMIQSIDPLNLDTMTMTLTLREVETDE